MNKPDVIILNQKSTAVSLVLTFFFGPFGMLYSTISGALVMMVIHCLIGIISLLTLGLFGLIAFPIAWVAGMVWGAMATEKYNREILGRAIVTCPPCAEPRVTEAGSN